MTAKFDVINLTFRLITFSYSKFSLKYKIQVTSFKLYYMEFESEIFLVNGGTFESGYYPFSLQLAFEARFSQKF